MKPASLGLLKSDSSFLYSFPPQREKLSVSNNAFKSSPVCSPLCGFRPHLLTTVLKVYPRTSTHPTDNLQKMWSGFGASTQKLWLGNLHSVHRRIPISKRTQPNTHTQHQQPTFPFLPGTNTDQLPQGCLWSFHHDELIRIVMTDKDANNTFWVPLCKLYRTHYPHTQPDPCMNPRRLVRLRSPLCRYQECAWRG